MTIFNGSSEMINNLSISVTTFLFNVVMLQLIGEDGVAAITIILYLDFLFVSISLGYSLGVGPLVSYNFGSKDIHKIKKLYFSSLIFSFTLGILTTIFVIIFSKQIVSIFVPQNSSVFLLAIEGIVIFAICYIFKCFNVFTSSFFTAFNNGLISGIISGMRSLLFLITAIIASAALFGAKGI